MVPDKLALTGVASLSGRLHPVCGLRAKLEGAAKHGSAQHKFNVILPAGNMGGAGVHSLVERSTEEINARPAPVKLPKRVRDRLHLVAAEDLFDSIELSLLKGGNREWWPPDARTPLD
jgi:predicted ATP-dependent protease